MANEAYIRRLATIRKLALKRLVAVEDRAVADVLRTALAATRQAQALLEKSWGEAQGRQLLAAINRVIVLAETNQRGAMLQAVDQSLDVVTAMKMESVAMSGVVSPRRLVALAQNFDSALRPDLRNDAYSRWIEALPAQAMPAESALRTGLADAALGGKTTREVVDEYWRKINEEGLPEIRAQINPMARATRIVRTELARLDNVAGITFDEAAGLSKFINLGVPDERQSEICAAATDQEPHSLDWWKASEFGIAPRHPNCRCDMFGVPAEVAA